MNRTHKEYWDFEANNFDSIYSKKKNYLYRLLDKIFRKDMFERFVFTINESQPIESKSFLDIGCGSGRFCLEYAKSGAKRILGIDVSPKMVEIARKIIKENKYENSCKFLVSEIFNLKSSEKFDISIAIGLFDYVKEPIPLLVKMRELTNEKIIISFPRFYTYRMPLRKIRLRLKGYVVYFYTKNEIKKMMTDAGYRDCKIAKIGKLYCVVGYI